MEKNEVEEKLKERIMKGLFSDIELIKQGRPKEDYVTAMEFTMRMSKILESMDELESFYNMYFEEKYKKFKLNRYDEKQITIEDMEGRDD